MAEELRFNGKCGIFYLPTVDQSRMWLKIARKTRMPCMEKTAAILKLRQAIIFLTAAIHSTLRTLGVTNTPKSTANSGDEKEKC